MIFVPPSIPALSLGRIKSRDIDRIRAKCQTLSLKFPGVTRDCDYPPSFEGGFLWSYDHHRVLIGHGKQAFDQAKKELETWGQFQLGWAYVDSETPVAKGTFVCVQAQPIPFLPIWTASPLRVTYSESATVDVNCDALRDHARVLGPGAPPKGRARAFRYAHTCLEGHFLAGEERFQVEYHPSDNSVWYDVCAVSRPACPVAVVAFPLLRLCQKRFAYDTLNRMRGSASERPRSFQTIKARPPRS